MCSPTSRLATLLRIATTLVLVAGATYAGEETPEAKEREHVVLLHGLGRSADSMAPLAEALDTAGYVTHNLDYPSTRQEPGALVAWLDASVERCCEAKAARVHFVTHSLGGILVRAFLAGEPPPNLGRVVLIAPPNSGSEIVDAIGGNPIFEALLGPTATELGTEGESFPKRIGPPDYVVGVIAGSSSINPVGSAIIPGPDDGTVSVEATRLEGAADFLVVDENHTFIMRDHAVAAQVIAFLRDGRFERAP